MWRRLLLGVIVLASVGAITAAVILSVRAIRAMDQAPPVTDMLWQLTSIPPPLGWTAAGAVLAALRPRNVLGWLFLGCGALLSSALLLDTVVGLSEELLSGNPWQARLSLTLTFAALASAPTVVLALYPEGRLPAPWWRWPVGVAIAGIAMQCGIPFLLPGLDESRWAFLDDAIGFAAIAPATATIVIATFVRWRRAAYPYRQQLGWFAGSGIVSYAFYYVLIYGFIRYGTEDFALVALLFYPMLVIPIGVAVGLLRYRLLGINAGRGLVYAALTFVVVGVYFTVTAILVNVLGDRMALPGVLAATIVAIGLAPMRDRLQRAADRLVYGARHDPLQALAELSDSVEATDRLDPVPAALATIMAAVRADGAVVITPDGEVLARAGEECDRYVARPLRFGGAESGELRVAEPAGGRYSKADLRLLTALAAQLAVVVSATQLTEALEAERVRVVTATRDERDRLRQDLHDGLGPSLTGMSLGLQALSGMIGDGAGDALVHRLRAEADTAVRDIRRIIDGLRPTVLDTASLTQAVQRHAGTLDSTLPVDVSAESLPVLAPDVEVAAYRIITEALTNAARHAHAQHASVTISADEALRIAVSDDGRGFTPDGATKGVGLSSMRRRAEALGGGLAVQSTDGGTTVTATLPLR